MKIAKILCYLYICIGSFSFAHAQNINTIAGNGSTGFSGDGGAATSAELNGPQDVALDTFGNIYIADAANHRIRKIIAATGVMTTIAGTGSAGYSGDGGAATSAQLYAPIGLTVSPSGDVYIADNGNNCIRKIDASTAKISTVAGSLLAGYTGDGSAATAARLYAPYDVSLDASGNIYIADVSNNCIRKVTAATGIISTVAGTGTAGFSGDGSSAVSAKLYHPFSVALDASGNMYIADAGNNRIRKVFASTGLISTIAGTGTASYSGDGGAASSAQFNTPYSIALDPSGNIYISDFRNQRIRKITTSTGVVTSIVGTGSAGFSGDGGLAASAQISFAKGIFVDRVNNVYIADEGNERIRFVCNAATIPSAPLVTSPVTLCTGSSPAALTAIGTGLKWYSSASGGTGSTTAPTPSVATAGTSTTYYVTQSSACGESPRAAITVNVVASPTTPVVSSPVTYCSGVAALPLTASGSGFNWYTVASGGSASSIAPTPSTASAGTVVYYVSQGSSGCESPRAAISVITNPTPVAPGVTDVLYCIAAPASAVSATGTNLNWFSTATSGAASTTAPMPITTVEGTTTYYVSQTNSFGCESSRAALNVTVNAKPHASITAATAPKFFVCKGSALVLKSVVTPYGYNFQWQAGTVDIPGATADSFAVTVNGDYRVVVSNAPNCNDTAKVTVDLDSSFSTTSINPTDINICDGVNIKLFSTSALGAGYKYQWIKNGVLLSDTNFTLVVSDKGNYQLKVTNTLGCSVISNTSSVNTFAPVAKPVIVMLGSTLSIPNTYKTYQWYRNNIAIAGANTYTYTAAFDGSYSVEVADGNGCKNNGDTVLIQALSIANIAKEKSYQLYPNPTKGLIYLQSTLALNVSLIDVLGRIIIEVKDAHSIDLGVQAQGVYIMRITDQEGNLLGMEKIQKLNQ